MKDRTLIGYWQEWIARLIEDRTVRAYFVTFQFRNMNGSDDLILERMYSEMETFYGRLLTRAAKFKSQQRNSPPIMIGSFDLPVPKKNTKQIADWLVNDGLHIHSVILMPHKGSFNGLLKTHIAHRHNEYLNHMRYLISIDVEPIIETPDVIANYLLKSIYRNRFDLDTIFVFPSSVSESHKREYVRSQ